MKSTYIRGAVLTTLLLGTSANVAIGTEAQNILGSYGMHVDAGAAATLVKDKALISEIVKSGAQAKAKEIVDLKVAAAGGVAPADAVLVTAGSAGLDPAQTVALVGLNANPTAAEAKAYKYLIDLANPNPALTEIEAAVYLMDSTHAEHIANPSAGQVEAARLLRTDAMGVGPAIMAPTVDQVNAVANAVAPLDSYVAWAIQTGFGLGGRIGTIPAGIAEVTASPGGGNKTYTIHWVKPKDAPAAWTAHGRTTQPAVNAASTFVVENGDAGSAVPRNGFVAFNDIEDGSANESKLKDFGVAP